MRNNNTKYWAFTWSPNRDQKKIPPFMKLKTFLDGIAEEAIFQLEKGEVSKKEHYQGNLTLIGPRTSKTKLLESFKDRFTNISGLTLSKVFDKTAVALYSQKSETRVAGPWYAGKNEKFDMEISEMSLKPWQEELYSYILNNSENKNFRDRKIIWVEDQEGNSGKSYFIKWLRTGQKQLNCRKLPVSSVERLNSAVAKIAEKQNIDLFMVDITRSKGKEQSYKDLFASFEDIKNGYVVDVMYGKYVESIFKPPMLLVFTNLQLPDHRNALSEDRWIRLGIKKGELCFLETQRVGQILSYEHESYPIKNGKIEW